MNTGSLEKYLAESATRHSHLCPRQVLGVRVALAGLAAFDWTLPPPKRRLLVILETDGCFADGVQVVTSCTVGNRTLRFEDYGKIAATFIEAETGQAFRIAPQTGIRERAHRYTGGENNRYFAQLVGYQHMPDDELLHIQSVHLKMPASQMISRSGVRTCCDECGEEIINEREVYRQGKTLCRACAGQSYYHMSSLLEEASEAMAWLSHQWMSSKIG